MSFEQFLATAGAPEIWLLRTRFTFLLYNRINFIYQEYKRNTLCKSMSFEQFLATAGAPEIWLLRTRFTFLLIERFVWSTLIFTRLRLKGCQRHQVTAGLINHTLVSIDVLETWLLGEEV